jgi:hypothetical protein
MFPSPVGSWLLVLYQSKDNVWIAWHADFGGLEASLDPAWREGYICFSTCPSLLPWERPLHYFWGLSYTRVFLFWIRGYISTRAFDKWLIIKSWGYLFFLLIPPFLFSLLLFHPFDHSRNSSKLSLYWEQHKIKWNIQKKTKEKPFF